MYFVSCFSGESLAGGYTVFVGMDGSSGDLLAIYDWSLHFKPAKRGDSRRLKQVCVCVCVEFACACACTCAYMFTCACACALHMHVCICVCLLVHVHACECACA